MGIETVLLAGSLAVAGGSAYKANKNAKNQVKAQNQALDYERKQNDLQAARQRRDAIRAARVAKANATNSAATQNTSDSSASMGGLGSIQSQLGDNLSFLDTYNKYSDQASVALGRANVYGQRAQMAQTVSGFGMAAFNNSDAIASKFNSIFKAA